MVHMVVFTIGHGAPGDRYSKSRETRWIWRSASKFWISCILALLILSNSNKHPVKEIEISLVINRLLERFSESIFNNLFTWYVFNYLSLQNWQIDFIESGYEARIGSSNLPVTLAKEIGDKKRLLIDHVIKTISTMAARFKPACFRHI